MESDESNEQIERSIREQINIIADNVTELEKMSEDLEKDHTQLKQKIERKAADLDRAEKRYRTLKKVRPAFMEEYDNLERELRVIYVAFLEKFRNLKSAACLSHSLARTQPPLSLRSLNSISHSPFSSTQSPTHVSRLVQLLGERDHKVSRGRAGEETGERPSAAADAEAFAGRRAPHSAWGAGC